MNTRRKFLKTIFALAPVFAFPKFMWAAKNKLPNVLILGDSISIGYTPYVKQMLLGWANISRPMLENGKAENWDVIHFNFGLHDLKHVDQSTGKNSSNPNDPQQANLKQYKKNLTEIVKVLKATKAKLIFATTTPYPDEVDGPLRSPGMSKKYNKVATKIMNKNDIAINNLYAFVLPRMNELQRPNNVHFTEIGSQALAKKVADRIKEALGLSW